MKQKNRLLNSFRTLKFQLILMVFLISTIPSLIVSRVLIHNYKQNAISLRESEIAAQAKILANKIGQSGGLEYDRVGTDSLEEQLTMLSTLYAGRVVVVNDVFRIIYDSYNQDNRKTVISREVVRSFAGENIISYNDDIRYIEMTLPVYSSPDDTSKANGVMILSASADIIAINESNLKYVAAIICAICAATFTFIGVLVALMMVRPLRRLSDGIEHIQSGYAGERLEVNSYQETADICVKFNELLARMRVMDQSKEEFVSNVSHELKTPLTSIKVLADSINSMPDAPVEMYQEFMGDITNEIDRETKIINDLLSLVKMDKSSTTLNIVNLNVNELSEQILKRLQPIADRQQVELVLESFRPIMADVDEVKLTLAISNLVENAIKYNKNDGTGWVHVSLNSDHQYFYLKVSDNGMGIPEDSLEQIYERFYRVDKSHSREIGGTGLGLAITRNAILMHRGAIKVYSVVGDGTTFDVRIPLKYMV